MTRKLSVIGFSFMVGLFIGSVFSLVLSFALGGVMLCAGICILLITLKSPLRQQTVTVYAGSLRLYSPPPDKLARGFVGAAFLISCGAGILWYSVYDVLFCLPAHKADGAVFSGNAVIESAEAYPNGGANYIAGIRLSDGRKVRAAFYSYDEDELVRGDRVYITAQLVIPDESGFFDSKGYYRSKGVYLIMDDPVIRQVTVKENNIFALSDNIRRDTAAAVRKAAPDSGNAGEMVIGLIFGGSFWEMDENTEDNLYRAGIGHVTAVSGMHMSIAAGMVSSLLAALRFGARINIGVRGRFAAVMGFTLVFALCADFTPSVVRSLIMIAIVYGADIVIRRSDPLTSLAASVLVMTAFSPVIVRDTGFILSVAGVLGSAVMAPAIAQAFISRIVKRDLTPEHIACETRIVQTVITPFCASAAVFPVSALCFDEISAVSPLINLIFSPLCSAAVMLAVTGAVLSLISALEFISSILFSAAVFICRPVIYISELVGEMPYLTLPTGMDIVKPMLLMVTVSVLACAVLIRDKSYTAAVLCTTVFICTAGISVYRAVPSGVTDVTLLSEGKGCVIAICTDSQTILCDMAGSSSAASAAQKYIISTGRSRASSVILTTDQRSTAEKYRQKLPEALIIASAEEADADVYYSKNGSQVNVSGFEFEIYKGYAVITVEDTRILCISSKCEPPAEKFDLVIYNCVADISADGQRYAVTRRTFEGSVPASAECISFTNGEFTAYEGELYIKEKQKWLR